MLLRAAVFLLLAAAAVALESAWDQAARDHTLDMHNEYRRNEGGCQVNKLEYDMDLEAQAKVWAEKCVFAHEHVKGRGENLAFSTYHHSETQLIDEAYQAWFDEKKDYKKGQKGCQRSCHYTQLVWHDTQKVGCWSSRCPKLGGANAHNAWYFVCFYTPMGNWVGREPYETQCTTPCKDGQTEENKLCVGEAIIPCVDKNESCEGWANRKPVSECVNSKAYMELNCRKACNFC